MSTATDEFLAWQIRGREEGMIAAELVGTHCRVIPLCLVSWESDGLGSTVVTPTARVASCYLTLVPKWKINLGNNNNQ